MIQPIPAIDIIGGKCVRLTKGDYDSQTTYAVSPLDVAKEVEDCGYRRLHLVDLDGARSKGVVNLSVLKEITSNTGLEVDFGGGIKSDADIKAVFDNGARWATVGSVAVANPEMFGRWLDVYGADRIILGADVDNGRVCINGWKEASCQMLIPFIESYYEKGVRHVLCTDISRDGMLQGTSVDTYCEIMARFPDLKLIASGGVGSADDIKKLDEAGIPAVVFGKAVYEGRINLRELAATYGLYLKSENN